MHGRGLSPGFESEGAYTKGPWSKVGAQPYIYYCPAKIMGGPGPTGPLDDYIPVKYEARKKDAIKGTAFLSKF